MSRDWLRSHWLVYALGLLFLAGAVVGSATKAADGGPLLEATIDLVLVALPGLLLLYVGSWLSGSEFEEDLYPRIGAWCLGGVGLMAVFLALHAVHPGVNASFSFETRAIAIGIGSVAGLATGIHEAQAITRSRDLQRRNEELHEVQRTLELRNQQLEQARTELERANERLEGSNERLEQFAHAASHDLREPLRMVTSYLQLLEDRHTDDLDEEALEFVAFAVDAAERMQDMVAGLLEFSRVDTRGSEFDEVDLDAVLEDVLRDLQVRIDETDAEITTEPLPTVQGDGDQLRQVLQNLVANAIDYSEDSPRVVVSAEVEDDEWVVSVADEGPGIEPDSQDRVFEIFQSAHDCEQRGSGIGLALCRRIVERHGGEIWVESDPGEGATFSFTIPQRVASDRAASEDTPAPDDVPVNGDNGIPGSPGQ